MNNSFPVGCKNCRDKNSTMDERYICRICGYRLKIKIWGEDGKYPSYEICPCCGVEFGNEDYTLTSILEYRKMD